MEHPHTLLMLVLKQHYHDRPTVIDEAKSIIDSYKNDSNPNYEKTLGVLYQLMSDLPPDILLYFLTMVPLPQGPMSATSTLIDLMKQMHSTNLLNNMRPTLLQYLNSQVQASTAAITATAIQNEKLHKDTYNRKTEQAALTPPLPPVQSVIDDNIKREKCKSRKKSKPKPRVLKQQKCFKVKELSLLCALNVLKNEKFLKKKYENLKREGWQMVNSAKNANLWNRCYGTVIRDATIKLRWLQMVKSGDVPPHLIYDQYSTTNIFYNIRYNKQIPDEVLVLSDALKTSIDSFLSKCC